MAVTFTQILPSDPISNGPTTINANFAQAKVHIDALEALLNTGSSSLKLTNLTTIPANSIEASSLVLTKTSGNAFTVSPNGAAAVAIIDVLGNFTGNKFTVTGTGVGNESTFNFLKVQEKLTVLLDASLDCTVNLRLTNSRVREKNTSINIVDANIGTSATNPIDIALMSKILMNFDNGGSNLTSSGEVKIDTTNLLEGQVFTIYCTKTNATGQRLWNGATAPNPLFARIDPAVGGIQSISYTTFPEFNPTASPNSLSFITFQWLDIGGGTFRFVILDHKNMNNVS